MTIKLVGTSQVNSAGSNVSTQSLPYPLGIKPGDLAIYFGSVNNNTYTLTTPSTDWAYAVPASTTAGSEYIWLAWRRITKSNPDPLITISTAIKAKQGMLVYRNTDQSLNPIFSSVYVRPGTQTTTVAPGITPTDTYQHCLHVFWDKSSTATAATGPSESGEFIRRMSMFGSGGGGLSIIALEEIKLMPSATGPRTLTYDVSSGAGGAVSLAMYTGDPIVDQPSDSALYRMSNGVLV